MHRQHAPCPRQASDGPVRKGVCHRTIVCALRMRPECALTMRVGPGGPYSALSRPVSSGMW